MRQVVVALFLVVALVAGLGVGWAGLAAAAQEGTPAGAEDPTEAEVEGIVATAVARAERLTEDELRGIVAAAVAEAERTPSLLTPAAV